MSSFFAMAVVIVAAVVLLTLPHRHTEVFNNRYRNPCKLTPPPGPNSESIDSLQHRRGTISAYHNYYAAGVPQ